MVHTVILSVFFFDLSLLRPLGQKKGTKFIGFFEELRRPQFFFRDFLTFIDHNWTKVFLKSSVNSYIYIYLCNFTRFVPKISVVLWLKSLKASRENKVVQKNLMAPLKKLSNFVWILDSSKFKLISSQNQSDFSCQDQGFYQFKMFSIQ